MPLIASITIGLAGSVACGAAADVDETSSSAIEEGSPQNLDVNDIGGVLGLVDGRMVPSLPLEGTFLPRNIFDQVIRFAGDQSSGHKRRPIDLRDVSNFSNWFPTGWRVDPCVTTVPDLLAHGRSSTLNTLFDDDGKPVKSPEEGKAELDKPTCIAQLRLVNQPVVGRSTMDVAMHLVYDLEGPAERDRLLGDLMRLKIKYAEATNGGIVTTNVPLGVHPALRSTTDPQVRARFAMDLGDIITRYVGKGGKNLTAVAFMGLENAVEPWVFFAGTVKNSSWSPSRIPAFTTISELRQPCNDSDHTCITTESFRQNSPFGSFAHLPERTQDGNFLLTGGQIVNIDDNQSGGQGLLSLTRNVRGRGIDGKEVNAPAFKGFLNDLKAAGGDPQRPTPVSKDGRFHTTAGAFDGKFDQAESNAVNNPRITNFFTTDCVSCHTSSQTVAGQQLREDNLFHTPPGITGFVPMKDLQNATWNVRNCGYFFNTPAVGLRTANEAAEGAAAINMYLLHQIKDEAGKILFPATTGLHNPGDDCSKNTASVSSCFIRSSVATIPECMGPASDKCVQTRFGAASPPREQPLANPLGPATEPPQCANRTIPQPGIPQDPANTPSKVEVNKSTIVVTLSTADATCLSRLLAGPFSGGADGANVKLECGPNVTQCTAIFSNVANASKASVVTVQGEGAARLRSMFGASFATVVNGPDGGLSIKCDAQASDGTGSCTLSPAVN